MEYAGIFLCEIGFNLSNGKSFKQCRSSVQTRDFKSSTRPVWVSFNFFFKKFPRLRRLILSAHRREE